MKLMRIGVIGSFLALALGGVFLCNPIMEFYDVLPDVFGYILICFGLWRLSDFCDDFADSLRGFRAMLWVSLGQMFVQWLLHHFLPSFTRDLAIVGTSVNAFEVPMLILIASFVWAILNCYFLIPAMKSLFKGFATLSIRSESSVLLHEKRSKLYWERVLRISIVFIIVMPILGLLPELTVLSSFSAEVDESAFNFYPFASMFRIVLGAAALVVGLVWLIHYVIFFVKILRDRAFCQSLDERYQNEIAPRKIWLLYRRYSLAIIVMLIGLLCTADLRIDGYPLVTSTYCVILTLIGYLLMGGNKPIPVALLFAGGVGLTVLSQMHLSEIGAYLQSYEPSDALRSPKAYEWFLNVRWLENLLSIFTCCYVFLFILLFWHKMVLLERKIDRSFLQEDKKSYIVKTVVSSIFLVGATVVSSVNAVFQLDLRYLWWIELALTVALFFTMRSIFMDIGDELSSCARLESANKTEENDAY